MMLTTIKPIFSSLESQEIISGNVPCLRSSLDMISQNVGLSTAHL